MRLRSSVSTSAEGDRVGGHTFRSQAGLGELYLCLVPLLDLRLGAGESGWEVLEQLMRDPSTKHIPVVVWSADTRQVHDRTAWLTEQGIGILPKPFDLDELSTTVKGALTSR